MNSREAAALDRYITGNYGEDQFKDDEHSGAEHDHADRAKALRDCFGTDPRKLAEFLHQTCRAFAKSPHAIGRSAATPNITGCNHQTAHDHGFEHCQSRMYFIRRATWLMTDYPHQNGKVPR